MDLRERGLRSEASVVFNRYLTQTRRAEDLDALAALPLFLSVRAAIRAKVTAARLDQAAPAGRAAIEQSARRYFDFACNAIAPAAPALIALGGLSGTGKSVLARALAPDLLPEPGAVVLRSDVERKALFGVEEHAPLPGTAYAPAVTRQVYAAILDQARRALAAGHSAIVDAVFARTDERVAAEASAKILGVRFHGLFLVAALDTRLARIGTRARDASDADAKVARAQESYDFGGLAWTRVDASGTPEETLAYARAAIGR
jgi:predicted kinase